LNDKEQKRQRHLNENVDSNWLSLF